MKGVAIELDTHWLRKLKLGVQKDRIQRIIEQEEPTLTRALSVSLAAALCSAKDRHELAENLAYISLGLSAVRARVLKDLGPRPGQKRKS